jgi:uncharacterized C2H2 Zn-finger protein
MGRAHHMQGREKKMYTKLYSEIVVKSHLGDLDLKGKTLLKRMSKKITFQ